MQLLEFIILVVDFLVHLVDLVDVLALVVEQLHLQLLYFLNFIFLGLDL